MIRRILSCFVCFCLLPFPQVRGQDLVLPAPGTMVPLSLSTVKGGDTDHAPILKGIKVYTDDPFRFDFVLSQSDSTSAVALANMDYLKEESSKLIKYFLAALTTPEKDMWVNLSPYEKDRIVPESFGQTEMGRDLLAQDYLLKQVTASLIYPEDIIGKKFWHKVYEATNKKYGNTNIPINTFNKVWIVPEKAVIYENHKTKTAYVVESSLKVLTEDDYYAGSKNNKSLSFPSASIGNPEKSVTGPPINTFGGDKIVSKIVRDVIIPQLTKEINEGENFLKIRQVYNSLILATWYKNKMKDSILSAVYTDQNKIAGVNIDDPQEKQRIYERYLEAFKKGAFNYIKETEDPITKHLVPKKYFSGGVIFSNVNKAMVSTTTTPLENPGLIAISLYITKQKPIQNRGSVQVQTNARIIDPKQMIFDPRMEILNIKKFGKIDQMAHGHYHFVFPYKQYAIRVSKHPLRSDNERNRNEKINLINDKDISPEVLQQDFIELNNDLYHFSVVKRIEGESLDKIKTLGFKGMSIEKASELVVELFKKMILKKLYLLDFKDDQFMLGYVAGEDQFLSRAWMVDTDELYYFVGDSLKDLTDVYIRQLEEKPLNSLVVDNRQIKEKLLRFKATLDMAQRSNSLKESSIDFDPSHQTLRLDGVDLVGIEHTDPHTLVYYYGEDYVFKISLDPDEEIIDVFEKGISPKIYQRGSIVKDGVTYQYYVQDRIEGYALDRITSELQQPDVFDYDFANKIDKRQRTMLMIELIKKLIENKLALEDWGDRQLMVGRVASDKNQSIRAWLIDTDLLQHVDKSHDEMTKIYVNYLKEMPLNDIVVDNELIINTLLGKKNSITSDRQLKRPNSLEKPFKIQRMKTLNGGDILYSLDSKDLDRIINSPDEYFIQGVDHETHLQEGKRRWIDNDKDLDFLDNVFGIIEKIRTLKKRNPSKNIVVLDWGCGEGTGVIELKRLLEAEGINIQAYGLSHDYYAKWQIAPKGVSFILDSGENLQHYFKNNSINLIVSTSALAHQFTFFDSYKRGKIKSISEYFAKLIAMLKMGGSLLIDAHLYKKQGEVFRQASVDFKVQKSPKHNGYYFEYQKDFAMISKINIPRVDSKGSQAILKDFKKGGIDFSMQQMSLQTNNPEGQIDFNISPELIEQWRQAPGIIPVIINITPLNSLSTFLNGSLNAPQDA